MYLIATLSPTEIAAIGSSPNADDLGGISLGFSQGSRAAVVNADLPARNEATDAVLRACHVPLVIGQSKAALRTTSAKPSATSGTPYNFEGIAIGMTKAEAISAGKAVASTPVKKGDGGGLTFDTRDVTFVDVATNEKGFVRNFVVCGKLIDKRKAGPKKGTLYELAIKAYGTPTIQGQDQLQWNLPRKIHASYYWDNAEAPAGCLSVSGEQYYP